MVSHQFSLSECKAALLIDSRSLRHTSPLAERVLVRLVIKTFCSLKVKNSSQVEASGGLIESAASLLST